MQALPSGIFLDDTGVLRAAQLQSFPWIEHGFGTRNSTVWPDTTRLAMLKQVHSANILRVHRPAFPAGEGDALITNTPGLLVGIRTADCVPILLADPAQRAVAAIHAGWRGAAEQIVTKTVERLTAEFGSRPADIVAAIGPAIGRCCYEVGPEVAGRFKRWFHELDSYAKVQLDLVEANRLQLLSAGLPEAHISTVGLCTCCSNGLFHSYRRDGARAGRMVSAIGMKAEG